MRDTHGFVDLLAQLDRNARTALRQALSHHGSLPCQPGKSRGAASVWASLKDCGLDTEIRASLCKRQPDANCPCSTCRRRGQAPLPSVDRCVYVALQGPNMFSPGDGLEWTYASAPWPNMKTAQHHACLELLAFFLVVGPDAVHLHPNTMADIEGLRVAARAVRERFLQETPASPQGRQWTCAIVDSTLGARERPPPQPRAITDYVPLAMGEAQGERDREVVDFLRDALSTQAWNDPSKLPPPVFQRLRERVEPQGFRSLLQRCPEQCQVRDSAPGGGVRSWQFKVNSPGGGDVDGSGAAARRDHGAPLALGAPLLGPGVPQGQVGAQGCCRQGDGGRGNAPRGAAAAADAPIQGADASGGGGGGGAAGQGYSAPAAAVGGGVPLAPLTPAGSSAGQPLRHQGVVDAGSKPSAMSLQFFTGDRASMPHAGVWYEGRIKQVDPASDWVLVLWDSDGHDKLETWHRAWQLYKGTQWRG